MGVRFSPLSEGLVVGQPSPVLRREVEGVEAVSEGHGDAVERRLEGNPKVLLQLQVAGLEPVLASGGRQTFVSFQGLK